MMYEEQSLPPNKINIAVSVISVKSSITYLLPGPIVKLVDSLPITVIQPVPKTHTQKAKVRYKIRKIIRQKLSIN